MNNDRKHRLLFVPPSTQDHQQGILSATVVLVMYGDYQCQESADVYRLLKVIGRQLSISLGEDYLCFIFRHFPQIQIHSQALRAAEAAQAAAVQGQFWQIHDRHFVYPSTTFSRWLFSRVCQRSRTQYLPISARYV